MKKATIVARVAAAASVFFLSVITATPAAGQILQTVK
jgi:hypothetical protein